MELHEIDEALFRIWRKVWRLKYLIPVNLVEEREKFFASRTYEPVFSYPPLEFDAKEERVMLDRLLESIKEQEKEPVAALIREKIMKLRSWLSLLEARGTGAFTEHSLDYYGKPTEALLAEARRILEERKEEKKASLKKISSSEMAERLRKAASEMELDWKVEEQADMAARANCVIPTRTLYVRKGEKFSERDVEKLRVHELGVHATRAVNGDRLGRKLFVIGTAGYEATEEGLAALMEEGSGLSSPGAMRRKAVLLLAIDLALRAGFQEVYAFLRGSYPEEKAFRLACRVKRGLGETGRPGAFTKDLIYLAGREQVKRLGERDVGRLLLGRIAAEDLPLLERAGLLG